MSNSTNTSGRGSAGEPSSIRPDAAVFRDLSRRYSVIPVVRELLADWWTPVAAFHRLAGSDPHAFLLESVEGGERVGRYSFLGRRPYLVARARGKELILEGEEAARHADLAGPPLDRLRALLARFRAPRLEGLPPFVAGAVGNFGYDTVRWVESLPDLGREAAEEDEATLLFLSEIVAFDHVKRRMYLVVNVRCGEGDDPALLHEQAARTLDALEEELHRPFAPPVDPVPDALEHEVESNITPEAFMAGVERAQESIRAGDIFQVVLSQRFRVRTSADDLGLYRSLRAINPSPYMFLLRVDGWSAVGSSPEPLVRVEGDRLTYRPIAGTVPRSGDAETDARRAEELLADPKERAEHVMLVDLGRNDLGRCAVTGSVRVERLMEVERYSHVMHIVSGLSARLRPGLSPLDALYACFPAGTVSGAPKIRAMEIIESIEPSRRGVYAGAVGYLDFSGNLDTCIALRTMVVRDGVVSVQAGAGIVADSDPRREYEETCHKAQALLEAVRRAGRPWRAEP